MVARFDAVRFFIFVVILSTLQSHFTLWLSPRTLQYMLFEGMSCHNTFVLYLALTSVGLSILLCDSVVPSATG